MADDPILVREARRADLEMLARWAEAMAQETEHKRLDAITVRRGIAVLFDAPARGRYFVAERGGAPAGALMLTHEWSDWRNADWWWIQSVYVDPAQRRHGVYRALHAHVQALAAATSGVCGLRLYVEVDNQVAQRTYAALGMQDARYRVFETPLSAAATALANAPI
jgi:ribosomal protein S18 acetylase RimI-like enzyme